MGWIVFVVVQIVFLTAGYQRERRAGRWQWSKFSFAMAFAALECVIIATPVATLDQNGRYFAPVLGVCIAVAVANFIWFIIACQRWRLPDGRTSLQAWRDEQARLRTLK